MLESWTGKLVGKMHVHEITYDEVAAELGVSRPYVSMLLNGHRKPPDAKKRIEMAIDSIIAKRAENGKEKAPPGAGTPNEASPKHLPKCSADSIPRPQRKGKIL